MRGRLSTAAITLLVFGIGLTLLFAAGATASTADTVSSTDADLSEGVAELAASSPTESTVSVAIPSTELSYADGAVASEHDVIQPCAAEPPDDFADPDGGTDEVIGWVEGYWYNEPLDLSVDDGLDEEELEKLSARTAARFEAMRCLTADDGLPPVEIIDREQFQEDQEEDFAAVGDTERLFDNAKMATLLMVDTDTDSIDVRQQDRGDRVGGFYDFVNNEIVIISDEPDSLLIDEEILAHELGHAIQDQQFNLSQYERPTVDKDKGKLGVIEGDVHLIEHEYLQACEADMWDEPCVTQADDPGAAGDPPSWGLYFKDFQPYSDGPNFVEHIYESGDGWDSVNDLYDDMPDTALYTVYPDKFGDVDTVDVEVSDASSDEWERITIEDELTGDTMSSDTIGVSGITGVFAEPNPLENSVLSLEELVNQDPTNPQNYAHAETEGWRGDSLVAYATDDDEKAAVWQLEWASEADAEPFVDSYREALTLQGGEAVDADDNVYEIETETFEMAAAIEHDGEQVTVVTAPTVADLDAVHQDLTVDTETTSDEDETDTGDDTGDADDDGAGFGVMVAAIAALSVGILARRTKSN